MSSGHKAPIKLGFVGLSASGWASQLLGPTLTAESMKPYIDLVAVSTSNPTSAKASAEKYEAAVGHPIKQFHGPTGSIAGDSGVDVVAVSVHASKHKAALVPIIEAGKDFFIEWPMTGHVEDAQEIVEKARAKGLRSLVGLQGRSSRFAAKIRETVKEGKIGTIRSTTLSIICAKEMMAWAPIANKSSGYYLKANGGHHLDILISILGDFFSVSCTTSTLHPTIAFVDASGTPTGETAPSEFPDHYIVAGTLKSGVVVNFSIRVGYDFDKTMKYAPAFFWEIVGEEGVITARAKPESGPMGTMASIHEPELVINGETVEWEEKLGGVAAAQSIARAWTAFAEGKESGDETYADAEDGLKLLRLLKAMEESGETGKTVLL